jgi:hypothetical protein
MSVRSWIEMPVSGGTRLNEPVRPRHAIEGDALLVYRGAKVYAALAEPGIVDRIAQLPDVRRLAPDEAVRFEATLPGRGAFPMHGHTRAAHGVRGETSGGLRLGDVVSWFTRTLHIRECGACSQRRKRLNKLTVRRSTKGRR